MDTTTNTAAPMTATISWSNTALGTMIKVVVRDASGRQTATNAKVRSKGAAVAWARRYGGQDVVITDLAK